MFSFENADKSWLPLLEDSREMLESIHTAVSGDGFLPGAERVLRFSQVPLPRVRVVILGQDPYPQPGAATGRSFEVGGLADWTKPFRQSSLRSIVRAVYGAYHTEIPAWNEVRAHIADGSFPIAPPDRLWDALEEQGVLFLNAYLTVAPGKPGAHRTLWLPFSHKLVRYIDEAVPDCAWFLWGSDARGFAAEILHGRRYESRHPMLTGPWDDDFLKNPCFRETKDQINWLGTSIS